MRIPVFTAVAPFPCQAHGVRVAGLVFRSVISGALAVTLTAGLSVHVQDRPANADRLDNSASSRPMTPGAAIETADPEEAAQAIEARYQFLGGPAGVLGTATSPVTPITGGFVRTFTGGNIYYSTATGAVDVRAGSMLDTYRRAGAENGRLGYPTGGQESAGVAGSLVQNFAGGRIYFSPTTGGHAVYGPILTRYLAIGGPTGVLGLPTSDELATAPAGARVSLFQNGRISWSSATGAWELRGVFLDYFRKLGYSAGRLGLPTSSRYTSGRGAIVQNFVKGRVYYTSAVGAQGVFGATLARYRRLGGSGGVLGLPTRSEYAGKRPGVRVTNFQHGRVWYSSATGARDVRGVLLTKYLAIGAETSRVGLPTGFRTTTAFGVRQSFQNGSLQYSKSRKRAFARLRFKTTVTTPTAGTLPYTYRSGCPVKPSGLRVVKVPFRNFFEDDAYGTIVVRSSVVSDVVAVFKAAHAKAWALHRVAPVDVYRGSDPASMRADNTSAFNCRKVTGNPYRLSQHSYGNAIDINPFENPYVTATKVYPDGSSRYLNRGVHRRGMIRRGDPVESTFRRLGWPWGARWRYPDYQHFSENGA
jgi:D-alanyl-D-alanine carboxypeptidase/LGFP repeat